ncbi:hypothetical protein [Actinomadura sp. NTSP31]|uniref:hypothetical protein n=1 Tax=Actinomadura sp. NTSP31 TaxID=1735447 RepID=UPI0035C1F2F5
MGCLLGWLALLVLGAGLFVFCLAALQLVLAMAGRGDEADIFPLGLAVGVTIGVPAVTDLVARLAGRRRIAASLPVANAGELDRNTASFGTKRVPFGLQELSFVPMLLLIPVLTAGLNDAEGAGAAAGVLAGILVTAPPMFCGLYGGPHLVLLGSAAWLIWACLIVEGHLWLSVITAATLGVVLWAMLYSYFTRAAAGRK